MRARNIKPGFFKNSDLAECEPLARILFAGLWCLADRRGRLEDRPKQIKGEVLPYDDPPIDPLLDSLQKNGFILRYVRNDKRYIQIINFEKHAYPHIREPESTIPAPDKNSESTRLARLNPESPILNPESTTSAAPKVAAPVISINKNPKDIATALATSKAMNPAAKPDAPYKTPETPLQKFLVGIKILQGFDAEDREWDKTYFKRYGRAASDMLAFFGGNWQEALGCSEIIVKDLESKKLSWTVETLVKHAPHYRRQIV